MRTAIISDVHANLVALNAVLGEIDDMGIKHIISAGDVVGYYPYPNEVIQVTMIGRSSKPRCPA